MKIPIALASVLLLAAMPALGASKGIKCWTDESGQRACGDSIPPRYAGQGHEVINEQGILVEKTPRDPTPAEREEQEQARLRQAELDKVAQRQHAYDRYLLESYTSAKELEKQRDARIEALDTRIDLVKKAIEASQAQLDSLVARKQALQKENKPIDKKLEGQIQEYRRAIIDNPKALAALTTERDRVLTQFDSDIARFRELRHETTSLQP
jgi:hypothetical protein